MRSAARRVALVGCAVQALVTCREATSPPVVPVAAVQIEPAADHVWAGDSLLLLATAFDSSGTPLSGAQVAWTLLDTAQARLHLSEASRVTPASATLAVDSSHFAWSWSPIRVAVQVGATADTASIPVWRRRWVWLANRTAIASGRPGSALEVAVQSWYDVDGYGHSRDTVTDERVVWSVAAGGGGVAPAAAITDSAGNASTAWTLGPGLGYQALTATIPGGNSVTVGAHVVADSTWQLSFVRSGEFCVLRLADRDLRCVTWDGVGSQHSWSPAGDRVAFVSDRSGNTELYVMRPDGTERVQLTHTAANEASPAWSPDGNWIAVSDDSARLRLLAPDGSRDTLLGHSGRAPAWAPDARRLAVVDNNRIVIVGLDGSATALTETNGGPANIVKAVPPAWSPDGAEIAYSYSWNGGTAGYFPQLRFVTPAGTRLTKQIGGTAPSYAPDGSLLAWTTYADDYCGNPCPAGTTALFVAVPDGTRRVSLAPALQPIADPRWRPVPGARR